MENEEDRNGNRNGNVENMKQLLLLFELERYRVLKAVNEEGKKPPRAMLVVGTGDSSWENICVLNDELESELEVELESSGSGTGTGSGIENVPIESIDYNCIYLNQTL